MVRIDSGLGWTCDSDYYVESAGALVTYPNGVLNKTTTGGAIIGYIKNQLEWCCVQMVSTDPDYCAMSSTNGSCTIVYQGSYLVDGVTWYHTGMYNNTASYNAIAYMEGYNFITNTTASTTNIQVVEAMLTAANVEFKKIIPSTDYVKAFVEGVEAETATRVNANKASIGTLSSLTTTDKSSLVAAINEINARLNGQ